MFGAAASKGDPLCSWFLLNGPPDFRPASSRKRLRELEDEEDPEKHTTEDETLKNKTANRASKHAKIEEILRKEKIESLAFEALLLQSMSEL